MYTSFQNFALKGNWIILLCIKKKKNKSYMLFFLIIFKGKLVISLCFKNEIENSIP